MNINTTIEMVKNKFSFIKEYGYKFVTEEIFNEDSESSVFIELVAENPKIKQEFIISLYPRKLYQIDSYISNPDHYNAVIIKNYIDQKAGHPPRNVPMHILDKTNFESSLEIYTKKIEYLFKNDFNKVVKGEEWISIPSYDPRDDY